MSWKWQEVCGLDMDCIRIATRKNKHWYGGGGGQCLLQVVFSYKVGPLHFICVSTKENLTNWIYCVCIHVQTHT